MQKGDLRQHAELPDLLLIAVRGRILQVIPVHGATIRDVCRRFDQPVFADHLFISRDKRARARLTVMRAASAVGLPSMSAIWR